MDYSIFGTKRRRRQLNSQTTRVRNKITLLALRITLAVTMIGGLSVAAIGLGLWLGILQAAPELILDDISPGVYSSIIVCGRTGEELYVLHGGENRTYVTLNYISPHMIDAIVAIEDERFWQHNGVDIRGIGRALHNALTTDGPTQGASTITQQLIKNTFRFFEGELVWKLQEQWLAVQMERRLTEIFDGCHISAKEYILEVYLNTVSFGRQNYGVQAAAMFYFGIDAIDLDIAQSAVIAAITQNPAWLAPDLHQAANWNRAQQVLNRMLWNGFITEEEHFEAMTGDVYSTMIRDGSTLAVTSTMCSFHDALVAQVRDDMMTQFGWTAAQAYREIFTGGNRIYSVQDREMQGVVDRHFMDYANFPEQDFRIHVEFRISVRDMFGGGLSNFNRTYLAESMEGVEAFKQRVRDEVVGDNEQIASERYLLTLQPQAAFILIDHHTGHVLAMRGIRGEKQASRAFCRATQAMRSPGSQLKTLAAFLPAFDLGYMAPSTVIEDIPLFIIDAYGVEERDHRVSNWYRGQAFPYEGLQSARRSIYRSGNVTSVRTVMDVVGIDTMWQYMHRLGFTTLVERAPRGNVWLTDRTYGLPLGSLTDGVFLIEMAAAYGAIANGGLLNRPVFYSRVVDRNGNVILENHHEPRRVMRDTTAYKLIDSLIGTVTLAGGTGSAINWRDNTQLRRDIPIAGKTGTSEGTRDLGFVGSTPYLTAAVWMGNDDNRPMSRNTLRGMPGATTFHGPLWRNIMQEIHEWERFVPRQFERPLGIIEAVVCRDSGLLATEICTRDPRGNRARTEIFTMETLPTEHCCIHQEHWVCTVNEDELRYRSGPLASDACVRPRMRVGLVRRVPIPEEFYDVAIADRQWEHHPYVRAGRTCDCGAPAVQDDWWSNIPDLPDWAWLLPGFNIPQPPQDDYYDDNDYHLPAGAPDPDYDRAHGAPPSLWHNH